MTRSARVAPNLRNTLVIDDPRASPAPTIAGGVFAFDSAFPTPGITSYLHELETVFRSPRQRIAVFGHTDGVGSDTYNKQLADRRAQTVLALLTTDAALFEQVHDEEAWGCAEHQAMLRAFGCDPGPPDGEPGAMTAAAVRAFQKGYARRLWFERYQTPRLGPLPVTGNLDALTCSAIRDTYVNYLGQQLPAARLVEPRFAGCGEYNPIAQDADKQRRVTLALFSAGRPTEAMPCVAGDSTACRVDNEGPRRCRYYREQIDEPSTLRQVAAFMDDQWMPTPSLRGYMSTLCALPDDTPVTFTVYRTRGDIPEQERNSFYDETPPGSLDEVARIDGRVAHGIAFAVWDPSDPSFVPFDSRTWYDDDEVEVIDSSAVQECMGLEELAAQHAKFMARIRYRPPIFKVEGDGQWLYSRAPGRRLAGLVTEGGAVQGVLVRPDGRLQRVRRDPDARSGRGQTAMAGTFGRRMRNDEDGVT